VTEEMEGLHGIDGQSEGPRIGIPMSSEAKRIIRRAM